MSPTAKTPGYGGPQPLVRDDEAAVDRDAGLLVTQALGDRATADRDEEQVGLDGSPALELHGDAVSPSWVAPAKRTPVRKVILRLRNARSSCLEIASSSAATSRGSASTIVTSAPKDLNTEANSTPMTPPPRTTTRAGTWSRRSAWSLVMTRPPISRPGSVLA